MGKQVHVSSHSHTRYHLLPPTLSIPYSAPFPLPLPSSSLIKSPLQEFQQSMLSESQFLPVPMATGKTENRTVGDVVFF